MQNLEINMPTWQDQFQQEIGRAQDCRARKNEGQARVCARRAAGVAVREYLSRRGLRALSSSAYDLLNSLSDLPDLPEGTLQSARTLTLRVNEQFQLPPEADLIREAYLLREQLLPGE